jgi:hypothetical protein
MFHATRSLEGVIESHDTLMNHNHFWRKEMQCCLGSSESKTSYMVGISTTRQGDQHASKATKEATQPRAIL